MLKRQKIYYLNPEKNERLLIESDQQAQQYFGIEWMETFCHFDTQDLPPLLIKAMSPTIGLGVYALEAIQKDQLIALYTGDVFQQTVGPHGLLEYGIYTKNATHIIDAEKKGNVGRFFQHLPNKESLKKYYRLYNKDYETVATANASFGEITINNQIYPAVYAKYDILKSELIGVSYGKSYWACHSQLPDLIHSQDGIIIHHQRYHLQNQSNIFDFA